MSDRADWDIMRAENGAALAGLESGSRHVVLISTGFPLDAKSRPPLSQLLQLTTDSRQLIEESVRVLEPDGLLFVHGLPQELAVWGQALSALRGESFELAFKYWIALDVDNAPQGSGLKPTHLGLLLFTKARPGSPGMLNLNTATVRVPHAFCTACGRNVKDWGGKKHLMNPIGTALSDIWRDLPRQVLNDTIAPASVLDRVHALTARDKMRPLHVVQTERGVEPVSSATIPPTVSAPLSQIAAEQMSVLAQDNVYHTDCVSFLSKTAGLHPQGVFDLAFADPPYNLKKSYDTYADALAEQHYIEWCEAWLEGMARTLKPGGALLVLNLPKWAVHHAAFLNRHLEFRNWIAWDALSDPRGKLMPAHYALLYYTKPGAPPVFNYTPPGAPGRSDAVSSPDSPQYCLRASCIKQRKASGDDRKVELTDVWFDIHRIKHKRDRDHHPCQLPEKLMERIIKLTTRPGDLVFDPFCGAGTTAIAATRLGRHFVVTEMDENYVRITEEKLAAMRRNADLFGELTVPRSSVTKPKRAATKRDIELVLQELARGLGRVPEEHEVEAARPGLLGTIDQIYPNRSAAFKRAKVALV